MFTSRRTCRTAGERRGEHPEAERFQSSFGCRRTCTPRGAQRRERIIESTAGRLEGGGTSRRPRRDRVARDAKNGRRRGYPCRTVFCACEGSQGETVEAPQAVRRRTRPGNAASAPPRAPAPSPAPWAQERNTANARSRRHQGRPHHPVRNPHTIDLGAPAPTRPCAHQTCPRTGARPSASRPRSPCRPAPCPSSAKTFPRAGPPGNAPSAACTVTSKDSTAASPRHSWPQCS